MPGTLFVVATPIGNLEDVSARAVRVLREVAVIAAEDTRRTAHLLARYGIETPLTSLHEHNEHAKTVRLVERLRAGESIALVSDAGTPTISDPGGILIGAVLDAGLEVQPVPGPSAILALLSVSGLSTSSFAFLGFPPIKAKARADWVAALETEKRTVVFFEAPHRIVETLEAIRVFYGECHIVVARELTKAHEQVLRGPVSSVLTGIGEPRGEFCVALDLSGALTTAQSPPPTDEEIAAWFGQMTDPDGLGRRARIQRLAKQLGLPTNRVYQALERAKVSGE